LAQFKFVFLYCRGTFLLFTGLFLTRSTDLALDPILPFEITERQIGSVEDNIGYDVHVCVCGCTASINRTVPLYSCTIIRITSVHIHFYVPTYSLRTILLNNIHASLPLLYLPSLDIPPIPSLWARTTVL